MVLVLKKLVESLKKLVDSLKKLVEEVLEIGIMMKSTV